MHKFLTVALAGTLGLAMFVPTALAKEVGEKPPELTEILSDPQSILNVIPALPDAITKVDPTVVRVFLYNERKREETESLAGVVENRFNEELLRLRRFKVLEAREAKITRVQSDSTTYQVSNTIESLARLRSIGLAVGADAVLMYSPQIQERMVLVSAKLVRVTDGEILWTERFAYNFDLQRAQREAMTRAEEAAKVDLEKKRVAEERRTRDNGLYVYTGVNGYSMRRISTVATSPDQVSPGGLCFGMTGLRTVGFTDNAAVGVDLELDLAGSVNTFSSLPLMNFSFTPMLLMRLDPLFVKGSNSGIWNLYLGAGETVLMEKPWNFAYTGKAGLMIRFLPDVFLNLGAIYMPTHEAKFDAVAGLNPSVLNYGGLTFQVTVGTAFK